MIVRPNDGREANLLDVVNAAEALGASLRFGERVDFRHDARFGRGLGSLRSESLALGAQDREFLRDGPQLFDLRAQLLQFLLFLLRTLGLSGGGAQAFQFGIVQAKLVEAGCRDTERGVFPAKLEHSKRLHRERDETRQQGRAEQQRWNLASRHGRVCGLAIVCRKALPRHGCLVVHSCHFTIDRLIANASRPEQYDSCFNALSKDECLSRPEWTAELIRRISTVPSGLVRQRTWTRQ